MIRLAINGARGRMGRRISTLARADERFELVAALAREDREEDALAAGAECDVLVDFSSPTGAERAARLALRHEAALLVGTTGLSRRNLDMLEDAARSRPVMIAPNTSLGAAVLNRLATVAARRLGADFDVNLIEKHHAGKRDAPSGTARRLADLLRRISGVSLPDERVHSIRGGDIAGEHSVLFAGPGELLEISHSVAGRDVFAAGALRAAAWLYGKPPGRYTIEDAFGLALDAD
ncbi:MAG: 4-hydroxy-tetrahydrodipicolinate reductase [Planctomycetota bacterium]|nr:4-hydroxy-tetrahydrodipicolinate reductase [Planctomycetota bacterium]